jgi:hypothetical protein
MKATPLRLVPARYPSPCHLFSSYQELSDTGMILQEKDMPGKQAKLAKTQRRKQERLLWHSIGWKPNSFLQRAVVFAVMTVRYW